MNNSNDIRFNEVVKAYIDLGYHPLPLPAGQKFPPATGVTGNTSVPTREETLALFKKLTGPCNIGLRMPDNVIAIDVDQYSDKTGGDTLKKLEEELGKLPPAPSTTKRGKTSVSRKILFRVPKGTKWAAKAGEDIDIAQLTHRYIVVAPSEVEGMAEQWYNADGEPVDLPPRVADLPKLPQNWQDHLSHGPVIERHAPEEYFGKNEADDWLSKVAPGWDSDISPAFVTGLAPALEAMAGNAHDTMNNAIWWAVRFSVLEGQVGLKAVLGEIKTEFFNQAERSDDHAREREYARSFLEAINKVRGEIEAGKASLFISRALPVSVEGLTSLTGATEVGDAWTELTEFVKSSLRSFSSEDAVGEILAYLLPDVVSVEDGRGEFRFIDFVSCDTLSRTALRSVLKNVVRPLVKSVRPVPDENGEFTPAEQQLSTAVSNAMNIIGMGRNQKSVAEALATALRDHDRTIAESRLDADPYLLGVGNEVLDLKAALDNPTGGFEAWLRPREVKDAVTKSLPIDIREGLKALEYREKSPLTKPTHSERLVEAVQPDSETRRFLQKAMGYAMFGENKFHKFLVWYGPGGSGKNSIADSVISVLGRDYASEITPEQFKRGSANKPDPEYAASLRTRVAFVNETDRGTQIDASAIKRATETRSGRSLYSNDVTKTDGNTIAFMTNRAFEFDNDSGVARRLAVIPFTQAKETVRKSQPPSTTAWRERDEEQAWFFNWLIEGFLMAMAEGLETEDYPPLVAQATSDFLVEADPSMEFFNLLERTGDGGDFVSTIDLKEVYRQVTGQTAADLKEKALEMVINRWFKDQGHEGDKVRKGDLRGYRGWVLNSDGASSRSRRGHLRSVS